jgi:chemotaxis family two-component system sensor kinase Cph1
MTKESKTHQKTLTSRLRKYIITALLAWTALIAGLLAKDILGIERSIHEMALREAFSHLNKDYATRLWASSHGGVYVPATQKTPPNPYLKDIEERDIKTPSGKALTLMNPAYMLRQMMDQYGELFGIWCHITSLKHFRKETAPDEWERAALVSFEKGTDEVVDFAPVRGKTCLRLMRPIKTEGACLKCHGGQGYRVGDIRGGVSVSVPMEPYLAIERKEVLSSIASFSLLWLVGMAGILFGHKRLGTQIKEKERVEHALEISEKNYSAVFDNSLTGIYVVQDDKLKLANQTLADIYGYEPRELIGMDSLELVHPDDRRLVMELREKRLRGEEVPPVYEVRSIRKDGAVIWVQRRNTLVSFDGKPAVLGNVLDVTRFKEAEETVKRQTEELSRSNQELQAFASVASHDLQEPLRKIRTFGDVVERKFGEQLGEEGRDYLYRMRKAAVRMQALIDALLVYSRVNAKGLDFKTVGLNDIVEEVISDLEVLIETKKAKVQVAELPAIEADSVQIAQLFQNLVSNSLKFGPEHGAPEVRISSEALEDAVPERVRTKRVRTKRVRIIVEDNGIGFDNKFADRIFRPFERLHSHTAYEGAGIGLATCRKIVERHGGTIEAKGVPDKGATFIITLPVKQKHDPSAQSA